MKDYFKEKNANLFTSLRANIYFVYSTKVVLYKRIVYKVVKKLQTRKRNHINTNCTLYSYMYDIKCMDILLRFNSIKEINIDLSYPW